MKIYLLLILLFSCSNDDMIKVYITDNIICREIYLMACGAKLSKCSNGNDYYCVQNVISKLLPK